MGMNYFQTCHKCTQMADMLDRHSEHPRLKCLQHHNLGQRRIPNFLEYIYRFSTKIKRYNICTYRTVHYFVLSDQRQSISEIIGYKSDFIYQIYISVDKIKQT